MKGLMTKQFSKWANKQEFTENGLSEALKEINEGYFDANLGGHVYKKRVRFKGRGKSGSARTIVCFKKGDRAIFIHGFAKNEKDNLSTKELMALKEFTKVLLALSLTELEIAITTGDFIEV